MHLELMRAVERSQHSQVQHAARLAGQARTRPASSPAVFGDELLQRAVEIVRARDGVLDELLAEGRLPYFQSCFKQSFIHCQIITRWNRILMRSMRCATPTTRGGPARTFWAAIRTMDPCPSTSLYGRL